jgi:N-acetylglucosaminyldiphosphoundecaprenol N-acetyl-beta-D-mannosaminyltransferase
MIHSPSYPKAPPFGRAGPARLSSTLFVDRPIAGLPMIQLMGVRLHAITESHAILHILDQLDLGHGGWVITPNLDHLRRLRRDPSLRELYSKASLVVADGMPLVWASRIQGTPLPERVAGSSLVHTLSAAASLRGRSIYFLGGAENAAQEAARVLRERYPDIQIAGASSPQVSNQITDSDLSPIIQDLLDTRPDMVYVGLGSPKQERLIHRLRPYFPHTWWLGIGVSLSFLAGHVRRAPGAMQKTGLEWLHRLWQEPRRLSKRYLVDGIPFAAALLADAAWRGTRRYRRSA